MSRSRTQEEAIIHSHSITFSFSLTENVLTKKAKLFSRDSKIETYTKRRH